MKGLVPKTSNISGEGLQILIVHTRWNTQVVNALTEKAIETLVARGVSREDITVKDVPGAFELPFATQSLLLSGKFDAAISIGVLIKGETAHFEYIADATSHGLMKVGLETRKPVIFGVLTCMTEDQALGRAGLGTKPLHNHGEDWALAAIEMAKLE